MVLFSFLFGLFVLFLRWIGFGFGEADFVDLFEFGRADVKTSGRCPCTICVSLRGRDQSPMCR